MKGCGRNFLHLDKMFEKYSFLLRNVKSILPIFAASKQNKLNVKQLGGAQCLLKEAV